MRLFMGTAALFAGELQEGLSVFVNLDSTGFYVFYKEQGGVHTARF